MSIILRGVATLLAATRRGGLGLLEESILPLHVWPGDIDTQGHMNNGRYLSVMDFGRVDWAVRTGVLRTWLSRRWRPLVGAATIRYRRPLHPLQRYTLHTRLLCWDDKWMYFEQRFEREGDVYAIAFVKGLVRGRRANVRPAEMLAVLGVFSPSPLMPAAITAWNESERLTRGEALSAAPARPETRMPN